MPVPDSALLRFFPAAYVINRSGIGSVFMNTQNEQKKLLTGSIYLAIWPNSITEDRHERFYEKAVRSAGENNQGDIAPEQAFHY